MGFDIEGCKKAVFHTHNQGKDDTIIRLHLPHAEFILLELLTERCGASHATYLGIVEIYFN